MTKTINELKAGIQELSDKINFFNFRINHLLVNNDSSRHRAIEIKLKLESDKRIIESLLQVKPKGQLLLSYYHFECSECNCDIDLSSDYDVKSFDNEYYCEDCYNEKFVECSECSEVLEREGDIFYNDDNEIICESCYDSSYCYCEGCNEVIRQDDSYSDNGIFCHDCYYENHLDCYDCGRTIHHDNAYYSESDCEYYCEDCYSESNCDEKDCQSISLENNSFDLIPIKKCFGVEIEIANNDIDFNSIGQSSCFGIKYDGSLDEGMELYSPILQGDIGYNQIKKVYNIIDNEYNHDSAGIHLHIDMREDIENFDYIKKLIFTYGRIENMIYSVINPCRKSVTWCKKLKISESQLFNAESISELRNIQDSRYHGFNIQALRHHRTIELRYKDSELNFDNLINWIKFNLYLFDYVKNNSLEKLKCITSNIDSLDRFITFLGIISKRDYSLVNYWINQYNKYNPSKKFDSQYRCYS